MDTKLQKALSESHADQLRGVDYQAAAIDAAEEFGIDYDSADFRILLGSPDPGCKCDACRAFDWRD